MPTREDIDTYSQSLDRLVELAQRDMRAFWARLPKDDPKVVEAAVREYLYALSVTYGDIASEAAAEWYKQQRAKDGVTGVFEPERSPGYPEDEIARVAKAASHLVGEGKELEAGKLLVRATQPAVRYSARDTIQRSSQADPKGARYARVPRGAKTCAFCAMLASRGWIYKSEESAGIKPSHYHSDCDCEIVPAWKERSTRIKGYDPEGMYDRYKAARDIAQGSGSRVPTSEILMAMRRLHPEHYKDGIGEGGRSPGEGRGRGPRNTRGKQDKNVYVGEWPEGRPQALEGVRPYMSLSETPRTVENVSFSGRVDKVNPNLGKTGQWPEVFGSRPYDVNCVRCSMALALQRLGYDVQAGAGSYRPAEGGHNTATAVGRWTREDGTKVRLEQAAIKSGAGAPSNRATLQLMSRQPEGAFGIARCTWEHLGGGHVWVYELRDGKVLFWDGQVGKQVDPGEYLAKAAPGTFAFARLDNAEPTDSVLDVISIPEPERGRK